MSIDYCSTQRVPKTFNIFSILRAGQVMHANGKRLQSNIAMIELQPSWRRSRNFLKTETSQINWRLNRKAKLPYPPEYLTTTDNLLSIQINLLCMKICVGYFVYLFLMLYQSALIEYSIVTLFDNLILSFTILFTHFTLTK